jgi:signal transduction histidine kinase
MRVTMNAEMDIFRLLKWRWWIAGIFISGLLIVELLEHDSWGINIFLDLEFIIFFSTTLLSAFLFELLARSNRKLNAALKILDYKHKFTLVLSQKEDWNTLTTHLVQFPNEFMDVVESALIFFNPDFLTNELVTRWETNGPVSGIGIDEGPCATCLDPKMSRLHPFKSYKKYLPKKETANQDVYCLPISDGRTKLATLRFKMAYGKKPNPEQAVLLNNVVDEMAISLITSQDRKIQADMRVAEAKILQRKDIWRDLHDHLSQNLAYLRLKLDQFSKPVSLPPPPEMHADMERMRDVADQSYLIVRNWLESRYPETQSQLADLILAYASEMAKQADIEINVSNEGQPLPIPPPTQRKIYYIFREVLTNISKHSGASKVDIKLGWDSSDLSLRISDNGKGFDPLKVDRSKHFGLRILDERVAELNGALELNSSLKSGTVVSIRVPLHGKGEVK